MRSGEFVGCACVPDTCIVICNAKVRIFSLLTKHNNLEGTYLYNSVVHLVFSIAIVTML